MEGHRIDTLSRRRLPTGNQSWGMVASVGRARVDERDNRLLLWLDMNQATSSLPCLAERSDPLAQLGHVGEVGRRGRITGTDQDPSASTQAVSVGGAYFILLVLRAWGPSDEVNLEDQAVRFP